MAPSHQSWRVYNVDVLLENDPGKDNYEVHDALIDSLCHVLHFPSNSTRASDAARDEVNTTIRVLRKSFDSRWKKLGQPKFVYTVEIDISTRVSKFLRMKHIEGQTEVIRESLTSPLPIPSIPSKNPKVLIVGAGPSGLFAALEMCRQGLSPTIIERGQPVEIRGRDIGALINRKILNPESNICYGEGGAGTWSDGKLTTRIGKNSDDVRQILRTLVNHGAPEKILVDGKPHLGTDRLVRILADMRRYLISLGATFMFNTFVSDLATENGRVSGVILEKNDSMMIPADVVVLAVGHSARAIYEKLLAKDVAMEPKGIAVGFRIEHPQDLINRIQYGRFGELCERGKGKVPVADYRLAVEVTSESEDRSCYSFCMCPGGQIVCSSVNKDELCINGMSFSQRQSPWANSALVVNVSPEDMIEIGGASPLRGVAWQRHFERKAAVLGGGNLVVPVQRVTDFLAGRVPASDSTMNPIKSSYRLGVKEAPCHEIYPPFITEAIRAALIKFDQRLPGFICDEAILHGVETRTSSPVQVLRSRDTYESISLPGLYPTGEGCGYAGGIVSAAVDGLHVARAIINNFQTRY